jgi:hypothetical protein
MRRLRKKIYKYITSKHYKKPVSQKRDMLAFIEEANLPPFLEEVLSKKKHIDLTVLKNINVHSRLSISEVIGIASQQ